MDFKYAFSAVMATLVGAVFTPVLWVREWQSKRDDKQRSKN